MLNENIIAVIMIILNCILSFIFGSLVGLAELLSRYSEPKQVLRKTPAKLYIGLNGIISILGYWAIKKFQGSFVITGIELDNVLIAGFSAMVVLRSSIANIQHNGKKIEIGIGGILQVFLDTIEKLFNRE